MPKPLTAREHPAWPSHPRVAMAMKRPAAAEPERPRSTKKPCRAAPLAPAWLHGAIRENPGADEALRCIAQAIPLPPGSCVKVATAVSFSPVPSLLRLKKAMPEQFPKVHHVAAACGQHGASVALTSKYKPSHVFENLPVGGAQGHCMKHNESCGCEAVDVLLCEGAADDLENAVSPLNNQSSIGGL